MQATVRDFDPRTRAGSVLLDDGAALPFPAEAFLASGLRTLRLGQRLRIEVTGAGQDRRVSRLSLATLPLPDAASEPGAS
jgi:2-phospho-L-lactate guanylyltransferase